MVILGASMRPGRRAGTGPQWPDLNQILGPLHQGASLPGSRSCAKNLSASGRRALRAQRPGLPPGQFKSPDHPPRAAQRLAPFSCLSPLLPPRRKHLRAAGPRANNPFLPWEPPLEVEAWAKAMSLLLKQVSGPAGHVLHDHQRWAAQNGLAGAARLAGLSAWIKTPPGCWFLQQFCPGWSQAIPRHLQLFAPAQGGSLPSPLEPALRPARGDAAPWPWLISAQGQWQRGRPPLTCDPLREGRSPWAWGIPPPPEPLRPPLQPAVCREVVPDDFGGARSIVAGSAFNCVGFAGYRCDRATSKIWTG